MSLADAASVRSLEITLSELDKALALAVIAGDDLRIDEISESRNEIKTLQATHRDRLLAFYELDLPLLERGLAKLLGSLFETQREHRYSGNTEAVKTCQGEISKINRQVEKILTLDGWKDFR